MHICLHFIQVVLNKTKPLISLPVSFSAHAVDP